MNIPLNGSNYSCDILPLLPVRDWKGWTDPDPHLSRAQEGYDKSASLIVVYIEDLASVIVMPAPLFSRDLPPTLPTATIASAGR